MLSLSKYHCWHTDNYVVDCNVTANIGNSWLICCQLSASLIMAIATTATASAAAAASLADCFQCYLAMNYITHGRSQRGQCWSRYIFFWDWNMWQDAVVKTRKDSVKTRRDRDAVKMFIDFQEMRHCHGVKTHASQSYSVTLDVYYTSPASTDTGNCH